MAASRSIRPVTRHLSQATASCSSLRPSIPARKWKSTSPSPSSSSWTSSRASSSSWTSSRTSLRHPPAPPTASSFSTSSRSSSTASTDHSDSTASSSPHSSVSPDQVSHFTALASSWWDPHGPSRILHLMNPLRHVFIDRCLSLSSPSPSASTTSQTGSEAASGRTFLDIGCGGGIFAESAARLPSTAHVTAVDPTPPVLAVARAHARTDPRLAGKLTYLDAAVEDLVSSPSQPSPSTPASAPAAATAETDTTRQTCALEPVDVVTLFEVVEHVQHPSPFLLSAMRHVRPGGWLVLSTISRTWTSWLTTKLVAEHILRLVPVGTHDWNMYLNVEEMKEWAGRQEGWGPPVTMGVVYVPGVGWREVGGSEGWGNYFFAMQRLR